MSPHPPRTHRRRRTAVSLGVPLALATTGALAFTYGAFGSGRYSTVQAAVDTVPANNPSRVVIPVQPGTRASAQETADWLRDWSPSAS
ncbi:hypothetical protein ACIHEJ_20285 [Streptomyces sp. NPDC052301]|uniref:hypothetical protein n=1 Tax=Streptomyces sp. NPDC052301 TaxID=3365687 RepID=UPI0037D885D7